MNKTWTFLSLTLALYGTNTFSGVGFEENTNWTGFYIGANAGYSWSANNITHNIGLSTYANPLFLPTSQIISSSLAALGTNRFFNSTNGFIGGGQIGYNAQFSDNLVIGIDTDLDALGQSKTIIGTNSVSTPQLGMYNANVTITRKLNYLGLLKGRLGVLLNQSFLVYGSGAFAYGGASLNTSYSVTETESGLLPLQDQETINKTLAGWAAGGGAEWLFLPCWSLNVEYIFYNLGHIRNDLNFNQSIATTPPTSYAGAIVNSMSKFTENTVWVGINYHFS